MVTTRGALRALVRAELGDDGAAQIWSDALLQRWMIEAVRDYGRTLPRQLRATLTSVAGQAEYSLPPECVAVARVEHPAGCFRAPVRRAAGDSAAGGWLDGWAGQGEGASGPAPAYDVWGSPGEMTLELQPAPAASGEEIRLRYLALYPEPQSDSEELAIPSSDDDLLVLLVCARALQWLATEEGKRLRWEGARGASAQQVAEQYERRYRAELQRRQRQLTARRLVTRY